MNQKLSKTELLAPAGNLEKLETALYFGADAVYFGGKSFSLRAFSDNFDYEQIKKAIEICHNRGAKAYITANILAHNDDFGELGDYFCFLETVKPDGVIISDLGVAALLKKNAPSLKLHISTQANVCNKYAARVYEELGANRIILARELSLDEISAIRQHISPSVQLEAFVHGAMCIAYSGRCLLSNYLCDRSSNRGECAQSCRWEYTITEKSRQGQELQIEQDDRGTYILNSKDLCLIRHLDKLAEAGISSFKIEGRMKTVYYVATVVNSYRRALDFCKTGADFADLPDQIVDDLKKTSCREFCEGFVFGRQTANVNLKTSKASAEYDFCALVLDYNASTNTALVEQRNRFAKGDVLQILSPWASHNKDFCVQKICDELENDIDDALRVQQRLYIHCPYELKKGDILRKAKTNPKKD